MFLQLLQISNSLQNALETFGPASRQYHTILGLLVDCLKDIENSKKRAGSTQVVDEDMLSAAMGFLEIGK